MSVNSSVGLISNLAVRKCSVDSICSASYNKPSPNGDSWSFALTIGGYTDIVSTYLMSKPYLVRDRQNSPFSHLSASPFPTAPNNPPQTSACLGGSPAARSYVATH